MAELTIRVVGGDRIAYGLRNTSDNLEDIKAERAAVIMLRAAKLRAPVKSGELRASGMTFPNGIMFTAPYAPPIHWGWPKRNIKPNRFALEGVEESRPEWIAVYQDTIQTDLDKIEGAA
jgi:hypothetical protein